MIIMHNREKNGDYYENPSLHHLMDDPLFLGKQWKKAFFAKPKNQYVHPNEEKVIVVTNQKNKGFYENLTLLT